ncbi:hypothetical protein VTJ49DRAFT_7515 [Mycothermus thermophilus]|uniref:SWR1-complex protein 5 n=1 Tax=Humicola insolens TaxID=85995 RepID=A0ABR3VQN8_HUMIN
MRTSNPFSSSVHHANAFPLSKSHAKARPSSTMQSDPVVDEDYVSEEDSDFAPDEAAAEESSVSENEADGDDGESATLVNRKRAAGEAEAEDAGFENSGDEAIIERGKKRQKKSDKKYDGGADDEGANEGPLIKTRRMRAAEKEEKRMQDASGPVTIDVDALWADMINTPVVRKPGAEPPGATPKPSCQQQQHSQPDQKSLAAEEPNLIRIKRTYHFAGKVHTEEKLVPRDSAEAKLYLAENPDADTTPTTDSESDQALKRLPRKAFRSVFEPTPPPDAPGGVTPFTQRRTDLNLCVAERLRAREKAAAEAEARKLNTVEKSRMDWAGFVDREGIRDELELAGKSKHSFATRQEFLARSDMVREEEARRVRMAGRV